METATDFIGVTSMHGWCTVEKANKLYELIKESKPSLVVELGVFGGRSLVPMALAAKENGKGIVLGIDSWSKQASLEGANDAANDDWWSKVDYEKIYNNCIHQIESRKLENCGLIRMKSLQIGLAFCDNSIDVLHQDSNHSELITTREVELYMPKLKQGGYWISDDTDWSTVKKSVEMILQYCDEVFDGGTFKIFRKR